jgi:cell division septation protein DedD
MPDAVQSSESPQTSERRLHLRQRVLLSCMQLADDNGGIILDISERGLAMHVVRNLRGDLWPQMRFQFSQSENWVETRGRIAWIGASKKVAGIEFVDLPEEARDQIREWITSTLPPAPPAEETSRAEEIKPTNEVAPLSKTETQDAETASQYIRAASREQRVFSYQPTQFGLETSDGEPTIRSRRFRQRARLFLATMLLLSAGALLSYHLRTVAKGQPGRAATASTTGPSPDSSLSPVVASQDASLSLGTTDFTLQVGAMKQEKNADALAELLRQKEFSAFVIYPGTSPFYRVVVGPFHSADAAQRVAAELRKQGFDAIREPPNAPSQ